MGELYVIVTGSRTLPKRDMVRVHALLDEFVRDCIHGDDPSVTLMHGACPTGLDSFADYWAHANEHNIKPFAPDWNTYGKGAGPRRNQEMIDAGRALLDAGKEVWVIGFPGGDGTVDCWKRAVRAKMYRVEVLLGIESMETKFTDGVKADEDATLRRGGRG